MRRKFNRLEAESEMRSALDRRDRLAQFMGCDGRVVDAILCEAAQSALGWAASDMDVEDFTNTILKARVDVRGQEPRVLHRWGV